MQYSFLIILVVLMAGMMWWQSRKAKQQQGKTKDFRESLQPGKEVATYSGLLGTIVSVDLEKEQVVIDSEGTQSKWRIQAITEPPVVPAYVHDDEVDENGNPLPAVEDATVTEHADGAIDTTAVDDAQVPVEEQTDTNIPTESLGMDQSAEPTSKNN
ncbi:MAG: preprotein translocase subunit YajC [Bifidobacterium aquikefiri]|uniref:Transporter n=1 Tax=Bifidobacterium aquikefiri TaxID=1653207 RepID=A0A261G708_9BIFI|nr:preprotein translocase subunit YajC [Bifidobacterium aquikefiri]OZG66983.1 transporter [Bifidobacterium aquikefiri]